VRGSCSGFVEKTEKEKPEIWRKARDFTMKKMWIYPLVMSNIAIENGHL
jgi:hypothetical protein